MIQTYHNSIEIRERLNERPLLKNLLKPLWGFLETHALVELTVNKPKELGLEIAGTGYHFVKAPELDFKYWTQLCHVLANGNGIVFDPVLQPLVSTVLPGGHRFEAMIGKNVEEELSVSIRVKRNVSVPLEEFGLHNKHKDRLVHLVENGANIIISGGTSSGKTTFLNQLIRYIPESARVLTVEDARELTVPHDNRKSYIVSRNEGNPAVSYPKIIDHLVRSRPDVIIAGEVSVSNAFPIIRMLNSGHSGFMCTVHANTPELALSSAIPQNIQMAGINASGIEEILYKLTDAVYQLHRTASGKREVTEILFPKSREQIRLVPDEYGIAT